MPSGPTWRKTATRGWWSNWLGWRRTRRSGPQAKRRASAVLGGARVGEDGGRVGRAHVAYVRASDPARGEALLHEVRKAAKRARSRRNRPNRCWASRRPGWPGGCRRSSRCSGRIRTVPPPACSSAISCSRPTWRARTASPSAWSMGWRWLGPLSPVLRPNRRSGRPWPPLRDFPSAEPAPTGPPASGSAGQPGLVAPPRE